MCTLQSWALAWCSRPTCTLSSATKRYHLFNCLRVHHKPVKSTQLRCQQAMHFLPPSYTYEFDIHCAIKRMDETSPAHLTEESSRATWQHHKKSKPGLVTVRWDRSGSIYHGQVHQVSEVLVDYLGSGRVVVWWPSCTRGKQWDGELVNQDGKYKNDIQMYTCSLAQHAQQPFP